jgi:hypothetical protein
MVWYWAVGNMEATPTNMIIIISVVLLFFASLGLISWLEHKYDNQQFTASEAREHIDKMHAEDLERFRKESLKRMSALIATAVHLGNNNAEIDFQEIWKHKATKSEVEEFENFMTKAFEDKGFKVSWVCGADEGPEIMKVEW